MAESVAGQLDRAGQVARTVTTKVRYPDFSIRSRSSTAPVGFADAERIGELACSLLDRALFQDIRRYFPITAQAQVAWAVQEGVGAAVAFIEEQIEAGALDGGVARCRATTRKGKPCQRTPLPERDYCPSHQHLERTRVAA